MCEYFSRKLVNLILNFGHWFHYIVREYFSHIVKSRILNFGHWFHYIVCEYFSRILKSRILNFGHWFHYIIFFSYASKLYPIFFTTWRANIFLVCYNIGIFIITVVDLCSKNQLRGGGIGIYSVAMYFKRSNSGTGMPSWSRRSLDRSWTRCTRSQ